MTGSSQPAVGRGSPAAEKAIDELLQPKRLYSAEDFRCRPCPVPTSPGVYAWYFDEVPSRVPIDGCHQALGHTLLYVGIAPKQTKGPVVKPSVRTLRHRMGDHFSGNAEGSTLRLTLGCLLSGALNIKLHRVGSGKRHTFTNSGEITLDKWMALHARVAWAAVAEPWLVEKMLLSAVPLPLNLQGNIHPLAPTLKIIRSAAKQAALLLPVVHDNGGPRKLTR